MLVQSHEPEAPVIAALVSGDVVGFYDAETEARRDHELPARMRTASAMAKQGKVDDAVAYLRRVANERPEDEAQLIVAEAQILRDAQLDEESRLLSSRMEEARRTIHDRRAAPGRSVTTNASV